MKTKIRSKRLYLFGFIGFLIIATLAYMSGLYLAKKGNEIEIEEDLFKDDSACIWNLFIDFESNNYLYSSHMLSKDVALSGLHSSGFCDITNLSSAIDLPIPTSDSTVLKETGIKLWFLSKYEVVNASMVLSIFDPSGNQIYWTSSPMKFDDVQKNIWHPLNFAFKIPGVYVDKRNIVRLYVWNHNRKEYPFYIDDITISFNENKIYEKPKTFLIDFEDITDHKISSKYAKNGFYSTFAKGPDGISVSVAIPLSKMKSENMQSIQYRFYVLSEKPEIDAIFAATVVDKDYNELLWRGTVVNSHDFETSEWQMYNGEIFIPDEMLNDNHSFRFYLWNKGNSSVYLDDVYIVVKEKGYLDTEDMSLCDLTVNPIYVPATNQPPYQTKYLYKNKIKDEIELNDMMTGNNEIIYSGRFNKSLQIDQLLHISKKGKFLVYFNDNRITKHKIIFEPEINIGDIFVDENRIIYFDSNQQLLSIYEFNKRKFEQTAQSQKLEMGNIVNAFVFQNNIIAIIDNTGKASNFEIINNEIILLNSKQLISAPENNIKAFSGRYLNNKRLLLLLYINNGQHKYEFFELHSENLAWQHYSAHSNKSIQGYNSINFFNSYYTTSIKTSNTSDLMLMLDKSAKFDLKLLEFNKLGYKILYNIDFRGFEAGKNPKFYETHKIISGNFINNGLTDILIFQNNKSKSRTLNSKTEIYSFKTEK